MLPQSLPFHIVVEASIGLLHVHAFESESAIFYMLFIGYKNNV
jgi:hypothetical protein